MILFDKSECVVAERNCDIAQRRLDDLTFEIIK